VLLRPNNSWGWRVVNYAKYRAIKREEDRREYHREYWHKRKDSASLNKTQQPQPNQPIAEAYAEAEAVSTTPGAKAPRFTPPTEAEVSAYCAERGGLVNPQAWINHYTANGWRVGKSPMRDWRAAVRTWEASRGSSPAKPAKFNPAAYSREYAARGKEARNGPDVLSPTGDVRTPLVIDVP
jgi:hypothetical protein